MGRSKPKRGETGHAIAPKEPRHTRLQGIAPPGLLGHAHRLVRWSCRCRRLPRAGQCGRKTLNGHATELLEELALEMHQASESHAYEHAAVADAFEPSVGDLPTRGVQPLVPGQRRDWRGRSSAAVVVLHADEGIVQAQDARPMVHRGDLGETVSAFAEHEADVSACAAHPAPLLDGVEAWLEERRGQRWIAGSRCG